MTADIETITRQDRLIGDRYDVIPFCDLPLPYRLAIVWRMSFEAGAWDIPFDLSNRCSAEGRKTKLRTNIALYDGDHGDDLFGIATVPIAAAKANVMEHEELGHFASFDAYHAWYLANGGAPHYGHADRWPCEIEFGDDEGTFADGWHRFHAYCRAGHEDIPVWFVPEERHLSAKMVATPTPTPR